MCVNFNRLVIFRIDLAIDPSRGQTGDDLAKLCGVKSYRLHGTSPILIRDTLRAWAGSIATKFPVNKPNLDSYALLWCRGGVLKPCLFFASQCVVVLTFRM